MSETKDKAELVKKIISAIGDMESVKLDGKNKDQGYKFPTVYGMITAVRAAVVKTGVLMFIGEKACIELAPAKTKNGYTQYRHQVTITVELTDGNASFVSDFTGIAFDTSDKACSKAYTAAYKQALKQLFMIQTGDDVEPDAVTPEPTMAEVKSDKKPIDDSERANKAIAGFSQSIKDALQYLRDKKSWTNRGIRTLVAKENYDEVGVAMTLANETGMDVKPNIAAINSDAADKLESPPRP